MSDLSHLRLENTASSHPYTNPGGGGGSSDFRLPPRERVPHAQKIAAELRQAQAELGALRKQQPPSADETDGVPITIQSDPGYELPLESLDRTREGIHLLNVKVVEGVTTATLFVRRSKVVNLLRMIERYETEDSTKELKNGTKKVGPKNQKLVESIASIRLLAVADLWQDDPKLYPQPGQAIWWELWARRDDEEAATTYERLQTFARAAKLIISTRFVHFPERVVLLAYGTALELGTAIDVLTSIAELRYAREVPTSYIDLAPWDQREFVDDLVGRLRPADTDAPAVCLLDTGVNRHHPLLETSLAPNDWQAVDPEWGASDQNDLQYTGYQHGTGMAGVALYRCLTDVLTSKGPIQLGHRLESVKLLAPPPSENRPDVYGAVTQQAVAKAEISAPQRNRSICMAVTINDERKHCPPSSWSAAVDQMCSGELDEAPKLMCISTGNCRAALDASAAYVYPDWNCQCAGIQDPSQAWNALTVGAYTDLVSIGSDPNYIGWNPIAPAGDLSPCSRTSQCWSREDQKGWPIKPDLVMEGGNYVQNGVDRSSCEGLSLLTTIVGATGRLLTTTGDTSAATAAAARMGAIIWSHYPKLWPETVRALMVHSSRWTPAMLQRFPGTLKAIIQKRLRCYGYGVPDLRRAVHSAENAATLLYEGELQPFHKVKNKGIKTKEMHVHQLPWPQAVLQDLGDTPVTMRITLSYFVEPSPGERGWERKFRYQSHGLRFKVKRPGERMAAFLKRCSRAAWDEDEGRPENEAEEHNWTVGPNGQTHGSIHSDWWNGIAADLADCGHITVYPVTGWWRERPHLGKLESKARYSLIISIETPDQKNDLYHAIENMATVTTEVLHR
jgi:hypothetical protein